MNLSAQKLDLDEMARIFETTIAELKHRKAVLMRGIEELDNGNSMIEGEGILAGEVKRIMSDGLDFLR